MNEQPDISWIPEPPPEITPIERLEDALLAVGAPPLLLPAIAKVCEDHVYNFGIEAAAGILKRELNALPNNTPEKSALRMMLMGESETTREAAKRLGVSAMAISRSRRKVAARIAEVSKRYKRYKKPGYKVR